LSRLIVTRGNGAILLEFGKEIFNQVDAPAR
jgi:hypothetical protein